VTDSTTSRTEIADHDVVRPTPSRPDPSAPSASATASLAESATDPSDERPGEPLDESPSAESSGLGADAMTTAAEPVRDPRSDDDGEGGEATDQAERSNGDDGDQAEGGDAIAPPAPLDADDAPDHRGTPSSDDIDRLEREGDIAADYLEELLDIADLDGDLDMDVEGDRAAVSIVGGDVRLLVGRDGEVLEALQELTRLAVYRETGERSRLMLDVGGFRADKRSRLEKVAAEAVAEVKASGERKPLDPMTPFERKVVHDVVAASGLSSASEGEEPRRYVVVLPG
jgi:spoIIIJ-associated protein